MEFRNSWEMIGWFDGGGGGGKGREGKGREGGSRKDRVILLWLFNYHLRVLLSVQKKNASLCSITSCDVG